MISCEYILSHSFDMEALMTHQISMIYAIGVSPSRSFPILVYFKETQTPPEMWNIGPGEKANSEEAIANGAGKRIKCTSSTLMKL